MQDENQALQNSTARVRHLVLKGSNEMSSLSKLLSSVMDLIEGCVNAAATNEVHWGARLVLTAALSQFLELEA
jgi:hypothetical protein